MKFAKALLAPMCALLLSGCVGLGVDNLTPQAALSGVSNLTQSPGLSQNEFLEPDCEATWQWPSRFGDIQFNECERGRRYAVQLTEQVTDQNIDMSTVTWSWHNCQDPTVYLRGDVDDFLVNPPHITTCGDDGYYLLLVYNDSSGERMWDAVWFRPGVYFQ